MGLFSFLNPLAAPAFPTIKTTYKIGYISAYHPPVQPFILPSPVLTSSGEPVLKVEEVGWALFYPADIAEDRIKGDGVDWLVRPISALIEGYSRFLGVSKHILTPVFHLVGSSAVIPQLHASAALLPPPAGKWPLLVFSHGLGGGKHVYSQLARALAGSGYVVLVLDHKDGTGPTTAIHETTAEGKVVTRQLSYIKNEELTWSPARDPSSINQLSDDKIPLRQSQLEVRHYEVYEAFRAFSKLTSGEEVAGFVLDEVKPSKATAPGRLAADWVGKVDVSKIAVGGHSFGGATTLHILSNPPPPSLPKLPISKVLLLDPWLDPLPKSDDLKLREDLPPVLDINSEGFTIWTDHFNRLREILSHWGASPAWFMTVLQISHHTFSDFPLLTPSLPSLPFSSAASSSSKVSPASLIATIVALSQAFLHTPPGGSFPALAESLGVEGLGDEVDGGKIDIVSEGPDKKGKTKRKIEGEAGEVRVHFRGTTETLIGSGVGNREGVEQVTV